jgi:hypothetical protein
MHRVTGYFIVIVSLLLLPWVLVGVALLGATAAALRRRLAHPQEAWRANPRGRSAPALPFPAPSRQPRPAR